MERPEDETVISSHNTQGHQGAFSSGLGSTAFRPTGLSHLDLLLVLHSSLSLVVEGLPFAGHSGNPSQASKTRGSDYYSAVKHFRALAIGAVIHRGELLLYEQGLHHSLGHAVLLPETSVGAWNGFSWILNRAVLA